jgi:hypothetical protein
MVTAMLLTTAEAASKYTLTTAAKSALLAAWIVTMKFGGTQMRKLAWNMMDIMTSGV